MIAGESRCNSTALSTQISCRGEEEARCVPGDRASLIGCPGLEMAYFRTNGRDRYLNVAKPPARTFVVVSRLMRPGWLIEIAVAAIDD